MEKYNQYPMDAFKKAEFPPMSHSRLAGDTL